MDVPQCPASGKWLQHMTAGEALFYRRHFFGKGCVSGSAATFKWEVWFKHYVIGLYVMAVWFGHSSGHSGQKKACSELMLATVW